MITPRKIISSSDDKYVAAIAKEINITAENLFSKLTSMKHNDKKTINDTKITKKKEGKNYAYIIEKKKEGAIIARIICNF